MGVGCGSGGDSGGGGGVGGADGVYMENLCR